MASRRVRIRQQQRAAREVDRVRCVEDLRIEFDHAAGGVLVGVGLGDAVEQVARALAGPRAPVSLVRSTVETEGVPAS